MDKTSEIFMQDVARSFNREIAQRIDAARSMIKTLGCTDEERQRFLTTVFKDLNISVE